MNRDGVIGGSLTTEYADDVAILEEALDYAPYTDGTSEIQPRLRAWRALANLASIPPPNIAFFPYDTDPEWIDWIGTQEAAYIALINAEFPSIETQTTTKVWADEFGNLPLNAGYWWDARLGLYHVRHRVYDPAAGRWLQRDPIGYAGGSNLYGYGPNAPWSGSDPMGLSWFDGLWDGTVTALTGGIPLLLDLVDVLRERSRQDCQRRDQETGSYDFDRLADQAQLHQNTASCDFNSTARGFAQAGELAMRTAFPAADAADGLAEAIKYARENPGVSGYSYAGLQFVLIALPGPAGKLGHRAPAATITNAGVFELIAKDVRFTQDSIKKSFKDGRDVQDLINALRRGERPNLDPIAVFYLDGNLYSLDNRRLYAYQQAGVPIKARYATPEEITDFLSNHNSEQYKFTSHNNGSSVRVRGK